MVVAEEAAMPMPSTRRVSHRWGSRQLERQRDGCKKGSWPYHIACTGSIIGSLVFLICSLSAFLQRLLVSEALVPPFLPSPLPLPVATVAVQEFSARHRFFIRHHQKRR